MTDTYMLERQHKLIGSRSSVMMKYVEIIIVLVRALIYSTTTLSLSLSPHTHTPRKFLKGSIKPCKFVSPHLSGLNADLNRTEVAMALKTGLPKGQNQNGSRHLLLPFTPFRFLDLPAEIRNMIYKDAFGGKRIHLCKAFQRYGPTRHYICPDDISSHCYCYGIERAQYEFSCSSLYWPSKLSHLARLKLNAAILRTCRQIYDEAIGILYRSNTFDVNRQLSQGSNHGYPLFDFTDQVRRPYLDYITRLEFSWFFHHAPIMDEMPYYNQNSASVRTWSALWDEIGQKFPNLCELVVRLIFKNLDKWVVGGYMWWALPMLKAVRGLRSCEILMEHSDPGFIQSDRLIPLGRLISLDDLAALMCLELSSPEDSPACVQKALHDYPISCKGSPSYPFSFDSRDLEWDKMEEFWVEWYSLE